MTFEVFEIGDVVQLKSGGPKMTVRTVNSDSVVCNWFSESISEPDRLLKQTFLKHAVKKLV